MADCFLCNRPIPGTPTIIEVGAFHNEKRADRGCADAWCANDREAILAARKAACAAGYHKSPGGWTKDPAEPLADAGEVPDGQ
jgi:hypothetical protein